MVWNGEKMIMLSSASVVVLRRNRTAYKIGSDGTCGRVLESQW